MACVRGAHASAAGSVGAPVPPAPAAGKRTRPPPLVYASARGGQGAAGGQFGDVGDDGSGAGHGIWGVEAGAAVGRGGSLPSEGGGLCGRSRSTPTPARASPAARRAHRVGARAVDVLQGVLPAVLGPGMCRAAVIQHQGAAGRGGGRGGVRRLPGATATRHSAERRQGGPGHPPRLTFSSSPPGSGSTAPGK